MSKKRTGEQKSLARLEEILSGEYVSMRRNVIYHTVKGDGEIDLLCKRSDGLYDVYEVKSTGHKRAIKRAHAQLDNILERKPYKIGNLFVYVSCTGELTKYV